MHRAATVAQAGKGNTNFFRCPYHGWTYRTDGRLTGVPYPKAYGKDFDKKSLGLGRAPRVAAYRGFVFASMADEGPSLEEHLGNAAQYVDLYVDGAPDQSREIEARRGVHRYKYEANWKFQLENALDGYHPGFVHQSYYKVIENRSGKKFQVFDDTRSEAKAVDLGGGHAMLDQRESIGDTYYERIKTVPGGAEMIAEVEKERGEEGARRFVSSLGGNGVNLAIFPNLVLIGVQIRVVKPVAANLTEVDVHATTVKGIPEGLNRARLRNHEAFFGPAGFGGPDDVEMFRRAYEGLQASSVEWLLLSRGLWREERRDGVLSGGITDETTQRAQYKRWRELMSDGGPNKGATPATRAEARS